jgi:cytochrome c
VRRFSAAPRLILVALALVGAAALGRSLSQGDGGRAHTDRARAFYQGRCAGCHDVAGAIGVALDERVLRSYGNAGRLHAYIRMAMPYDAPRTLSEEEAWLATAHLLRSRGIVAPDAVVDGSTAQELLFTTRPGPAR